MAEVVFKTDGLEGFKRRVLEHARALDRGELLPSQTTFSFESPKELIGLLTPRRIDLLQKLASDGDLPVNLLAKKLRRTRSAINRDLGILKRMGVVRTRSVPNAGHGRMTLASPLAAEYDFVCSIRPIGASNTSQSRNSNR